MQRANTCKEVLSVGHQTAGLCPSLRLKHSGEPLLYREVDDLLSLLKRDSILQNEERVGALLGNRGKSRFKVPWALHLMRLKRYSQLPSRSLRLFPSKWQCWVARIAENRASRQPRHYFLECLQAFCTGFRSQLRTSREIAAWVRKTGDQTGVQRIDSVRMHDRDGRRRFLDGKGRGRCDHNDDVHIQANHLSRKFWKSLVPLSASPMMPSFRAALCISAFNDEILALHVTQFLQPLEQRVVKSLVPMGDEPHPPNFASLLRLHCQRQRLSSPAEQPDEMSSLHDYPRRVI